MSTKPPSRTADQFVLRLPDGMRPRIAEAAKANGRSMNAEIVARLEASFAEKPANLLSDQSVQEAVTDAFVRAIRSPEFVKKLRDFAKAGEDLQAEYQKSTPKDDE
jgi:hypothetical protein